MFWLKLKKINPMNLLLLSIGNHMLYICNVFLNDVFELYWKMKNKLLKLCLVKYIMIV